MPWIEVRPMDAKVLFIADYLRNIQSFAGLCRAHGISRKTGYKWVRRYESSGFCGLSDLSRRPHQFPEKIPFHIRKEVIKQRKRRKHWGAKKIREILIEQYPDWDIPSRTAIYKIIKAEGLIQPKKRRRRVAPTPSPFLKANKPNEVWSADFKGPIRTRHGKVCYPLTIMDHASRYLLACDIVTGTKYKDTRACFEKTFRQYGLPDRIRTDNGVPFASISVAGLSRLSAWWVSLGVLPERIEPGKPQQNGRHERMHRTLKQETANPPAATIADQQKRFDEFSKSYNEERPHEAIGLVPPNQVYKKSDRKMPDTVAPLTYPSHYHIALVNHNGCIWLFNKMLYLGYLLQGQHVGLEEVDERIWRAYFGPVLLGWVKEDKNKDFIMTKLPRKV